MGMNVRSIKGVSKIINRPAWVVGEAASLIGRNPNMYGYIQRQTHSRNREVVFYINQVGGVGLARWGMTRAPADGVVKGSSNARDFYHLGSKSK